MTPITEEIVLKSGIKLIVEKLTLDDYIELSLEIEGKDECLLHWGLCTNSCSSWQAPQQEIWPEGTRPFDKSAVQTPFKAANSKGHILIRLDRKADFSAVAFVLFFPEGNSWDNNNGKNYSIRLPGKELFKDAPQLSEFSDEIIKAETGRHSWTLMHRFNLCYDLADKVQNDIEGLALLFVWLRFSAIRQLDWQRNYNTKPKELSHSQDRLTLKLTDIYINNTGARELVRLMMTTLGRGGEGQRIRDEILNIMHRHHIKEVSGHFMEEWHQKVHNNTTPDDIVICEAYLAFLRSNGNLDTFYNTLRAGGVTKERLASFERPIVTPPDFVHYIKDGLIHDFEHYLGILKSVHSGTDLSTAVHAARYLFDGGMNDLLTFILHRKDDTNMPVTELMQRITEARRVLNNIMNNDKDTRRVRDALFLDAAMDEFLRTVAERSISSNIGGDLLVEMTYLALENLRFSFDDVELTACFRHWERLKSIPRFSLDWSLHAKSVLDRIGRAISGFSDRYYRLFQSKAISLGSAFNADSWAVNLFSEEIVRGRLAFVLSMLMHYLDPILRKSAHLGDWQVISPGKASGLVEVVDSLRSVQGKKFDRPTVIIADKVMGDEEPPEGITAVITPDMTDIVSHVAIRARNAHLLFATCYDEKTFEHLKSFRGRQLNLVISATGDVVFQEGSVETNVSIPLIKPERRKIPKPEFSSYAVPGKDFRDGLVGAKSNNLKSLYGKLPDWIHLPASAALPFGVAEKVLSLGHNLKTSDKCRELTDAIESDPPSVLAEIRKTMLLLDPPEELPVILRKAMDDSGLQWPGNWVEAWMCIKRVWASKWNERAYLSRKARGIGHNDLFMAVLIQQVVEADYAFVIHTVNPLNNDSNELYAEVVNGLGETLVGNYPGRALSFTYRKDTQELKLMAYPGKSIGLFGGGLIFRSDSNGEDLVDYAGAGLYDSVMLKQPREAGLNYTDERLVWDTGFREKLMTKIAEIGAIVEKVFNSPQDIEGAYADGQYYVVQARPQI